MAGTTTKYYDGLDRLVEVVQPQDATVDIYTTAWMTRYLYDLTQGGTVSFSGGSGATEASYSAYGNLFKTQEYLPAGTGLVTYAPSPMPSTGPLGAVTPTAWVDVKGATFDGLDRTTAKYSLVNTASGAEALNTELLTYDSSPLDANVAGLLGEDCNAVGQCQQFDYTADEQLAEFSSSLGSASDDTADPTRTYGYDADARTTSIAQAGIGTQAYTYDANGRLSTSTDANGNASITAGGSTITHAYYPDGKEQSLSVASSVFTQTGLFTYSYRTDGRLETQAIDDANLSGVVDAGTTTLAYTYTSAGRLEQRTESGAAAYPANQAAATMTKTWSIPAQGATAYGFETGETVPEIGMTNFQYDPEGEILGAAWSANVPQQSIRSPWTYAYTTRGELSSGVQYANGVADSFGFFPTTTIASVSWDDRMGVMLNVTSGAQPPAGTNPAVDDSWAYDAAGRLSSETVAVPAPPPGPNGPPNPAPLRDVSTSAFSYDAENHATYGGTTKWGPNGHPILIGGNGVYETLHWNGDQILFSTATINGKVQVDDIKIGMEGDITPVDTGHQGLTFYDRGPDGTVMGCHNATGAVFNGIGNGWTYSTKYFSVPGSPCQTKDTEYMTTWGTVQMPTSIQWGTGLGSANAASAQFGGGEILGVPRGDGYAFGLGIVQGVRTYDGAAGTWTTPDAYAGDVDDPASQKSYMWNGNNPVAYGDPSGYDGVEFYDASDSGSPNDMAFPGGEGGQDTSWASFGPANAAQGTADLMSQATLAQQGDQSAVPTGLQVEPSQTTFDAAATEEYGFHVDDWFYQLTNADGQPVTGKDYQAKESVVPAGDGTVTSNGQWPWIGGTEIRDQVGGSVSSILFQTFDIKYNGQVYSLPQELVHEVTVDPNGVTSTRVFEIVPDPMP